MSKIEFQPNIEEVQFTHQWVNSVSGLIDQAQLGIVNVYNLDNGFHLTKASDNFYPRKTNPSVPDYYSGLVAFNVNTHYPNHVPLAKRLHPKSIYYGRPRFADLGFVIAAHPESLPPEDTSESLADLLISRKFYQFNIITEETSHYIYNQVQYDLNSEIPSGQFSEAMALVDMYLTGREILIQYDHPVNASGDLANEWRTYLLEKVEKYKTTEGDPMAQNYSKASYIIEGYLRRIMENDMQGGNVDIAETQRFYRLSEIEKMYYLHRLYGHMYHQEGDNRYKVWQKGLQYMLEYPGEYYPRERR